jgi:hypothetical protein
MSRGDRRGLTVWRLFALSSTYMITLDWCTLQFVALYATLVFTYMRIRDLLFPLLIRGWSTK